MEDSDHTVNPEDDEVLHKLGHRNTGVVLQGRLFRTLDDLEASVSLGPDADVRIYKESTSNTQT